MNDGLGSPNRPNLGAPGGMAPQGGYGAPGGVAQQGGYGAPGGLAQQGGYGAPGGLAQQGGFGAQGGPASQGGYGAPQGQAPQSGHGSAPPVGAKKGKGKGCLIAGCSGCLVLMAAVCGLSGWLFYLEEGRSLSDPGEEVAAAPLVPGQPVALSVLWDGTGYAHHGFWIEAPSELPTGFRITGEFGCNEYGELRTRSIDANVYYADPDHPNWLELDSEYFRASPAPVQCAGTLTTSTPIQGARVVVTRMQRPSDWLSGL